MNKNLTKINNITPSDEQEAVSIPPNLKRALNNIPQPEPDNKAEIEPNKAYFDSKTERIFP